MRLLVHLFIAVTVSFITQDLLACSCVVRQQPKDHFKVAEIVFVGRVISYEGEIARFEILQPFKGSVTGEVEIATPLRSEGCGYGWALKPGSQHLIYAFDRDGDRLETELCDRSAPVDQRVCDLSYLRKRSRWWRCPLSSIRLLKWFGVRLNECTPYFSAQPNSA